MTKPRVLICCDYYLPGVKAGGPIRSVANFVDALKDEFEFVIVARDRDWGDNQAYSNMLDVIDGVKIYYLSPAELKSSRLKAIIKGFSPHRLYLNSFFSWHFSIKIILLRFFGKINPATVVLAPRGEFSRGALKLKSIKKRVYIAVAKCLGLYKNIQWHATSVEEENDIHALFTNAEISVASNVSQIKSLDSLPGSPKQKNKLKLVFLSRVSQKKNLRFALEQLASLEGEVIFDIYGPIEDEAYWHQCENVIKKLPANIRVGHKGLLPHDQVVQTFSQYDAFILPTLGENYGHVILEALAAGCPVLLSDTTPWLDLTEKRAGWVLPLDQVAAWREQLQALVYMDEAEHARLRKSAIDYARKVLNSSEAVESNKRLFEV